MAFKIISAGAVKKGNSVRYALQTGSFGKFCGDYFGPDLGSSVNFSRLKTIEQKIQANLMAPVDWQIGVVTAGAGRLNLIGEHTDYNLIPTVSVPMQNNTICAGFRHPASTNSGTIVFANSNPQFKNHVTSLDGLKSEITRTTTPPWYFYPGASLLELVNKYPLLADQVFKNYHHFFMFDGQPPFGVPVRSGLSSSAAIEMATILAAVNLNSEYFPAGFERYELAEIGVAAENLFANCGRLDQHTSIGPEGRQGVMLDYWQMVRDNWSQAYKFFNLPEELTFGVVDSGQEASTAQLGYRIRRLTDWVMASMFFKSIIGNHPAYADKARQFLAQDELRDRKPSLRDVFDFAKTINDSAPRLFKLVILDPPWLPVAFSGRGIIRILDNPQLAEELALDCGLTLDEIKEMGPVFERKFARYVLGEADRVGQFFEALQAGRLEELGPLLLATHFDMTNVYEAGTARNTEIVKILQGVPGVLGSRIVGAGFGGFNMFAIHGKTPTEREEIFARAKTALADAGFTNCFLAPPGCGSAVFEL